MRAVGSHQIPATIVKKLINAGANINARDSFGRTAMDYLQGAKVEELADGTVNLLSPGDKDFEKKMSSWRKQAFIASATARPRQGKPDRASHAFPRCSRRDAPKASPTLKATLKAFADSSGFRRIASDAMSEKIGGSLLVFA